MLHELILENREKYFLKFLRYSSINMKLLKLCFLVLLMPESGVSEYAGVQNYHISCASQWCILPLPYITEFCHVARLPPTNKQHFLATSRKSRRSCLWWSSWSSCTYHSNMKAMFPLWCSMSGQGKLKPVALFGLIILEKCVNFSAQGCNVF